MKKDKIKVLLVEDDIYMNRILYDRMTKMGLIVDTYFKAGDAIDMTKNGNKKYDLIVLDYLFDFYDKTINGLELYDYLKRRMPHARGIMVSAFATVEVKNRAAKMGITDFLDKPFPIGDFTTTVERILSGNQRNQINA